MMATLLNALSTETRKNLLEDLNLFQNRIEFECFDSSFRAGFQGIKDATDIFLLVDNSPLMGLSKPSTMFPLNTYNGVKLFILIIHKSPILMCVIKCSCINLYQFHKR